MFGYVALFLGNLMVAFIALFYVAETRWKLRAGLMWLVLRVQFMLLLLYSLHTAFKGRENYVAAGLIQLVLACAYLLFGALGIRWMLKSWPKTDTISMASIVAMAMMFPTLLIWRQMTI